MKKLLLLAIIPLMMMGCKKDNGTTPDTQTPAVQTLDNTFWYVHSGNMSMYMHFSTHPIGTIEALQDGTGNTLSTAIKWVQNDYNVTINFTLPGQNLSSYSGTYQNGRLTLDGIIWTKN